MTIIACVLAIIIGGLAGDRLQKTFSPDSFSGNPYGYGANQWGHFGIGVVLVFILSFFGYLVIGEIPAKISLGLTAFLGYVSFEITQKGAWRDCIEDTLFVCYGGGMALFSFDAHGDDLVAAKIFWFLPWLFVALLHIAIGWQVRVRKKKNANNMERI